jgi:hypothetical protein
MALVEIINNAGTVLIDDNYSNACLSARGSLTLGSTFAGNGNCYVTTLTITSAQLPMLALELSDVPLSHFYTQVSNTTWTFTIFHPKNYAGRVINYYVFSIPSLVGNAGGQLQLFNAAGQLVFDSNLKYMRVFKFYATTLNNATIASDLTAGRVFAAVSVIACSYRMHQRNPSDPGTTAPYMYIDASNLILLTRSGNSLVSQNYTTDNSSGYSDDQNYYTESVNNGRVLLIDVTNY